VEVVPVRGDKGKDTAVPARFTPGRPRSPEDLIRVLQAEGIRDRRVLAAFREVPRARFVPPAATGQAYRDEPIRISHGQVTTQPSLIARMVAALGLTGSQRVLEVGTGLGFQTAILARLARQVVSVERFPDLAAQARANLATVGLDRVRVVVGDGTLGVPEHAPYQAIVVSAASPSVPAPLVDQLASGGRLVHPVGPGGREQVTAFHKEAGQLVADARLTPAYFVPLVGAHGRRSREGRDER
jgi:protein-L-isoaspartate(D-aspartate) O-methyltransferase